MSNYEFTPEQEDIIRDWVKRLRSGEYKQATGRLKKVIDTNDDGTPVIGHCCLGVVCEIAAEHGVIAPSERHVRYLYTSNGPEETEYFDFHSEDSELPWVVADWLGLKSTNPEVTYTLTDEEYANNLADADLDDEDPETVSRTEWETLADLNDTYGRSFAEIADIIEAEFLGGKS